jgi:cation diffusion facilitator family transporter
MSQRMSRSSRLSLAERELAAAAASEEKESPSCGDWLIQVIRGERRINHVAAALKLSLGTNIMIVLTMTAVAIGSKSLALLSTLVENMIDLFVQGLLAYAGTRSGKKQDYAKFPAGTSRFEPVAVIVASSVMVVVSIVFIQEGSKKLYDGFAHGNPAKPDLTVEALIISGLSITTKIFLMLYSRWVLKSHTSAAVEAIQDDNRNDVVSNSFAITAYIIASARADLWYVDPAGAIVIFLLIMIAWGRMGKEQVMQLVGVTASEEFIGEVKQLCNSHNNKLSLDIVRAYHFGSKYLVEVEVVVPGDMTVQDAHDIALQLQFKVEQLEDVERAFVHVDYKAREYDEHIVSREEDALLMYAGYSGGETPGSSVATPVRHSVEVVVTPTGGRGDSNVHFQELKG